MTCEEKERLGQEYEEATERFSQTVHRLQQNIGTTAIGEYERLRRASDEAGMRSE